MAGKHRRIDPTDTVEDTLGEPLDDELEAAEAPAAPMPRDLEPRDLEPPDLEPPDPEPAKPVPAATAAVSLTPSAVLPGPPRTARQALRAEKKQKARRLRLVAVLGVVALVLAAVGYVVLSSRGSGKDATKTPVATRSQQTLLLQLVDSSSQTVAGVLLAQNRAGTGSGFGALVPATLLVQVPGLGGVAFSATSAGGGSGAGTGAVAVQDALNVTVDNGWRLSTAGFIALLDSVGGVDVTVDEDIEQSTAGGTVLLMHAGTQHLSGAQAAAYATYLDVGAPEQQRLARFSSVLNALLAKLPQGSASISTLLSSLSTASVSTLPPAGLGDYVEALRTDAAGGRLTFDNVPTHPLDPGGTVPTVVVDNTSLAAFVKTNFSASVPSAPAGGPVVVLVQNGVGTPGLDDKARTRLVDAGLTFTNGGNASSFDNPTSTILIADGTAASRTQGALVARALGLPTTDIKITELGQNVADVVVVLGADFKP